MTNQEASEIIKDGMEDMSLDFADEEQYEALTMAIKALEEPSGDLISREDVEECKELMTDINGDTVYAVRMSDIRQLPSVKQEPRWVPVSESLPEKNMACLVAIGKFNITQMAMYSDLMGTIDHRIFYQGDMGYDNFENITEYVKAWMPLPKPYEPQESENKK